MELPKKVILRFEDLTLRQQVQCIDWSGYSVPEIADALKCTPQAIRHYLKEAEMTGIKIHYVKYPNYQAGKRQICERCENRIDENGHYSCGVFQTRCSDVTRLICPRFRRKDGET